MNLSGKKVAVVGLARSGMAACKLLLQAGAKVSITDCLNNRPINDNIRALDKRSLNEIEIGRHTQGLIGRQDLLVVSPGVSAGSLPILWAKKKKIPVISEIELASAFCPAPIIAITGTNGKTTVTTLVGQILRDAGRRCVVCGNIGNPFSAEVGRLSKNHTVVLEVSSFQLETIDKFKPKVAAVLNLAIDHLDRYKNFDDYLAAKCRIFANQDSTDWAVLNQEDPYRSRLAGKTKARVVYFSQNRALEERFKRFNSNHFAALAISSLFGVPEETGINTCLRFKGVEHRLEQVARIKGVEFVNDSKATNVDSTLWALESISKPIVLIAGGRDKGSDFTVLREKMQKKVKAMILLGEAREKITRATAGTTLTKSTADLTQAVECAFRFARPGDCVLLSPMCASFDMFKDYTERGRAFKQAVKSLKPKSE